MRISVPQHGLLIRMGPAKTCREMVHQCPWSPNSCNFGPSFPIASGSACTTIHIDDHNDEDNDQNNVEMKHPAVPLLLVPVVPESTLAVCKAEGAGGHCRIWRSGARTGKMDVIIVQAWILGPRPTQKPRLSQEMQNCVLRFRRPTTPTTTPNFTSLPPLPTLGRPEKRDPLWGRCRHRRHQQQTKKHFDFDALRSLCYSEHSPAFA